MSTSMHSSQTAIKWVLWGLMILLGVIYAHKQYAKHVEKIKAEQAQAAQQATEYRATHPQQQQFHHGSGRGREKNLYNFSSTNGCVAIEIQGDYDFYPKGGEVVITPPSPAKSWHDKPGTVNPRGETPSGTYTVCKVDSNAWGVEVWN